MRRFSIASVLLAVAVTGFALGYYVQPPATPGSTMAGLPSDAPTVPPVTGYVAGEKILFLHTEASDPEIAGVLTDMMGSPVPVVPSLAQAPEEMLARVYVYANGVKPEGPRGPLGFQPDVFENSPGQDGYTPLRMVYRVTWKDESSARLLKSADQVEEARKKEEVTVEKSGVVVNMPFLTWPGGQR